MPSSPEVSPPPLKRRRVSLKCKYSDETASIASRAVSTTPAVKPRAVLRALRVYSWNVNGITPFLPLTTPKITDFLKTPPNKLVSSSQPSLRACLRKWSWPHIICLQEVKIALSDSTTQAAIKRTVNSALDQSDGEGSPSFQYNTHFCLPRDKHNATGFGGKVHGVCTFVRRDLPNVHIRTVDWELEGRVLITELGGDQLAVINVYAVNGTSYDYRDPISGKVIGTRHDRKRAFHTLLCNEIGGYEAKGWNVLVIGDINISRSRIDSFPQLRLGEEHVKNRADFERKFMQGLGMVDTFRCLHGEKRKYTYRPPHKPWGEGGDRVDLGLITPGLTERLEEADMLDTKEDRGTSDHVPLFVSLKE